MNEFIERVQNILQKVDYKNFAFDIGGDDTRLFMQVRWPTWCAQTRRNVLVKGRKWWLSTHMTKSEIVQTAFKAVLTAEEHEVRENFKYNTMPIFGPHFDVDLLHRVCLDGDHLDVRKEHG